PPVEPTKVLGIHQNWKGRFDDPADYPSTPRMWLKGGPNVVAGHGDTIPIPDTGAVRFEAELAVVVGEQCRHIHPEEADAVIAGYTCLNDISDGSHTNEFRTKSFDHSAPIGPVLASRDRVPAQPRIRLWRNGKLEVDLTDDEFIYTPQELVAAYSTYVTLEPGDVIGTGNPGGSQMLADGDTVAIEIEGIGRLEHDVEVREWE
ncbi:MAG: fumarylacetoacetate hydrolase family protein, partial [Halobacteriales archaeon]|nr:fumarylacetoacetate hydrolase family protein [Halobacteriales archaeon]